MSGFFHSILNAFANLFGLRREFSTVYEGRTLVFSVLSEKERTCMLRKVLPVDSAGNKIHGCPTLPRVVADKEIEYTVTGIGERAFSDVPYFTEFVIPESVTEIGNGTFDSCNKLASVTIPDSVTTIGKEAFIGCSALQKVYIPDYVTEIGASAFRNCTSLIEVRLPSNLSVINPYTFYYSSALTTVSIPESVIRIGDFAFSGCTGLKTVVIPDSVTELGRHAYDNCDGLTDVTFGKSVKTIGDAAFLGCAVLSRIHLQNSLTKIGQEAFRQCPSLTAVFIPDSVQRIGSEAFADCFGLEKSAYPKGLKNPFYSGVGIAYEPGDVLCEHGWIYNLAKTAIVSAPVHLSGIYTVPDTITEIKAQAFIGCKKLTGVVIAKSVITVGERAFCDCTSVKQLIIRDAAAPIAFGDEAFIGCSIERLYLGRDWASIGRKPVFSTLKSIEFKNGMTEIPPRAFENCTMLTSVILSDTVKVIGDAAFAGCCNLKSVTVPSSVVKVGERAFSNCETLKELNINDASEPITIGKDAFAFCVIETLYLGRNWTYCGDGSAFTYVKDMKVGRQVTEIPQNAFAKCSVLASVTIPATVTAIGESAFAGCTALRSIVIPVSVSKIGPRAFDGCTSIESLTIPATVLEIDSQAFRGCNDLRQINIKDRNRPLKLGQAVFSRCAIENLYIGRNLERLTGRAYAPLFQSADVKDVKFGNYVTLIPDATFKNSSRLASVTIPQSVMSIGDYAFYNCRNIKDITIEDCADEMSIGNKAFGDAKIYRLYVGRNLNNGAYGAESIFPCVHTAEIGDMVTTINDCMFMSGSLRFVKIGRSVERICNSAFYGCRNLQSVLIPPSVRSIGPDAFRLCSGLLRSAYPSTLSSPFFSGMRIQYDPGSTVIEDGWIYSAKRDVIIFTPIDLYGKQSLPPTVSKIEIKAFAYCRNLKSIAIPSSVTFIGKDAFKGCTGLTQAKIPMSLIACTSNIFPGCANLKTEYY